MGQETVKERKTWMKYPKVASTYAGKLSKENHSELDSNSPMVSSPCSLIFPTKATHVAESNPSLRPDTDGQEPFELDRMHVCDPQKIH